MSTKTICCLFILVFVLPAIQASFRKYSTKSLREQSINAIKKRKIKLFKPESCSVNFEDKRSNVHHDPNLTTIYFVTPTYPRPEQIPELTRLSHTLMHVPKLHWIVADDNNKCCDAVTSVLIRSGLPYTQISSPKPHGYTTKSFPGGVVSRGVPNRKAALKWIRRHAKQGILYFGDDDNTYDLELFREIRKTKKLSMVPVGLVSSYGVSSPVLDNDKVIGFFDSWGANRKFPVDMAGFAVNLKHLRPVANMPFEAGMLEDKFLTSAGFQIEDIEPLADNCTKVLVWHTQTFKNKQNKLRADPNYIKNSTFKNLGYLLQELAKEHILKLDTRKGIATGVIQRGKVNFDWGVAPGNKVNEISKSRQMYPLNSRGFH